MHRKAKHFYGTIIPRKGGKLWGVLLVDSTSEDNPFTDATKDRFNSFAKTITEIIKN